ncbi:MAG: hypothetical protein KDA85_20070, partial [Planctomycetaceae bacterium]|nr:hypothetical protein [Planctomycetaceae bacterium]
HENNRLDGHALATATENLIDMASHETRRRIRQVASLGHGSHIEVEAFARYRSNSSHSDPWRS